MKIINKTRDTIISTDTEIADTAISRLVGLLNRSSLPKKSALIITECRSIHMFFMKFAIDVIFVNKKDQVVGLVKRIKPFRLSPYFLRASYVIEIPPGTIEETNTSVGDLLVLEK